MNDVRCPVCRNILHGVGKGDYHVCPNCEETLYIDDEGYVEVVDESDDDYDEDEY